MLEDVVSYFSGSGRANQALSSLRYRLGNALTGQPDPGKFRVGQAGELLIPQVHGARFAQRGHHIAHPRAKPAERAESPMGACCHRGHVCLHLRPLHKGRWRDAAWIIPHGTIAYTVFYGGGGKIKLPLDRADRIAYRERLADRK